MKNKSISHMTKQGKMELREASKYLHSMSIIVMRIIVRAPACRVSQQTKEGTNTGFSLPIAG